MRRALVGGPRDYQQTLLEKAETVLQTPGARVMLQLPTGGGKTHIAGASLRRWLRNGSKARWLTHRTEPADQTYGFRLLLAFGLDRGDTRYMASLATKHVAKFTARLNEADYATFKIADMAGFAQVECSISVPEGQFVGTVSFIEDAERGPDYRGLICWFTEP